MLLMYVRMLRNMAIRHPRLSKPARRVSRVRHRQRLTSIQDTRDFYELTAYLARRHSMTIM
jgi:hypothetical protein